MYNVPTMGVVCETVIFTYADICGKPLADLGFTNDLKFIYFIFKWDKPNYQKEKNK